MEKIMETVTEITIHTVIIQIDTISVIREHKTRRVQD
jgi:hypothetical protein